MIVFHLHDYRTHKLFHVVCLTLAELSYALEPWHHSMHSTGIIGNTSLCRSTGDAMLFGDNDT